MRYLLAFLIGGALCIPAQILIDKTKLTPARILVGYVVTGVFLSAVGIYAPFVELAGCGASTPLLGFGHALAKGVREAIHENGAIGILTGGFTGGAGGMAAALFVGLIVAFFFKSKQK